MLMENYGNADYLDGIDGEILGDHHNASGFYAMSAEHTILYYLIDTGDYVFSYVITCPNEAMEGFASRVIWMLKSVEIYVT
jgi:hypothetical protein